MKNKFSFIIDVVFVSVISFALSLVLFYYFIPYPYSIVYATCAAAISTIIFFSRSSKKNQAERLKKAEQKELLTLVSELNFCDRQEQNDILEKGFISAGYNFERRRGAFLLKDKDAVVLSRFSFNKVVKADVIRAFNMLNNTQKAYILAESFDADVIAFAERFNGRVNLVDGAKVFKFLKDNNAMPVYKYKDFAERKKKGSLKNLLDKKKAKTFLAFGLVFLLTAYFTPLKIYYLVCGCLFLIYALALRFWGKDINLNSAGANNI